MDKNILKNRVALLLDLEYNEAESIINTFFQRISDTIANKSTSSFYLNKIGTISTKYNTEQYIETDNGEYKYYPQKIYADFSENIEAQSLTIRDIKVNYTQEGFSLTNKYRKVVAIIRNILDDGDDVYIDKFGVFSKNTKITFTASNYLLYRVNPYFNLYQRNVSKNEYVEYFYKNVKTEIFLTAKERAKIIEEIVEEHIDTEYNEDNANNNTNINNKDKVDIIEEIETLSTEEKTDELDSIKEDDDDNTNDEIIEESEKNDTNELDSIKKDDDDNTNDEIIEESEKDDTNELDSIKKDDDNTNDEVIEESEKDDTNELDSIKKDDDNTNDEIIEESEKDDTNELDSIKKDDDNTNDEIIEESEKDDTNELDSIKEDDDDTNDEIIEKSDPKAKLDKSHIIEIEIIETIGDNEYHDNTEESIIDKVYSLNIDIDEVIENDDNNVHIIGSKEYNIDVEMEALVTKNKPYTHKINLIEHVEQKPLKKSVIGVLDNSLKENNTVLNKKSPLKVFIILLSMIVLVAFSIILINKIRMPKEEEIYTSSNEDLFDIVNNHFISINNANDINYIVSKNQYFWDMSKDVYKDSLYWPLIFALNQTLLESTDMVGKGTNVNYRALSKKERNRDLDVTLAKSYISLYEVLEKENRPKHARWVVKLAAYFDFNTFKNSKGMIPEDIYNEVLNYKF